MAFEKKSLCAQNLYDVFQGIIGVRVFFWSLNSIVAADLQTKWDIYSHFYNMKPIILCPIVCEMFGLNVWCLN